MEYNQGKTEFPDLLKYSFELIKKNWRSYFAIFLLELVPTLVFFIFFRADALANIAALNEVNLKNAQGANVNPIEVILIISNLARNMAPVILLQILLSPFLKAAKYRMARRGAEENPMGVGEMLKTGLSGWLRVFFADIAIFLIGIIPLVVISTIWVITIFLAYKFGLAVGILMGLIALIGTIVVFGLYFVKISFIYPIFCSEDISFIKALKKSFSLSSRGQFWSVFLNLFFIVCVAGGINIAVSFSLGLIPYVGEFMKNVVSLMTALLFNTFLLIFYMDRESLFPENQGEESVEIQF